MRHRTAAILLVSTCAAGTPARAAELSPAVRAFVSVDAPLVALTHVRLIDGTGAPALEDQTIVIAHGRIAAIGGPVPAGATTLDLHGRTVLPGLVLLHEHLFFGTGGVFHEMALSFPRLYLAGGVTTLRTGGSLEPYTDLELKRRIEKGEVAGPKMDVTGPYLEGSGTPFVQMHALTGPEDARRTVSFWADQGATSFKLYNYLSRAEAKAAIDEAHRRGLKVTGHLCSIGFREAAQLGIDNLEHGLLVDTEFFPEKKADVCPSPVAALVHLVGMGVDGPGVQETIRTLVAHKVAVTSTLPVFELLAPARPAAPDRVLDVMSASARTEFLTARARMDDPVVVKQRYGSDTSPWTRALRLEMDFERAFVRAGGLLVAGCDPTGIGGTVAGFGDQRALELLVEAGFTPLEAIRIGTRNGAEYLGRLQDIGTVELGKAADLVVVNGAPDRDIADVERVETVFKDGVGYDSAKLIASVRGLVGIR